MTFYINNPDDDGLYSKQKYYCTSTAYRSSVPTIEQRLANLPGHGIFIDEGYPDEAFDTLFYFTTSREMNDGIEVTRSDNITYTGSTYNIQRAYKTVTETYITSTVNTSAWYNTTETRRVTFSADIEKRVATTTLSYRVVSGQSGGYSLRSSSVSFHKYSVTTTARYQYLSDSSLVYGNLNIELSTNSVVNANTFSYTRSATNGAQTKTTGTFIINQGSAASTFTGSSFTYNASFYQVVLNVLKSSTTWQNPENKDKYTFTAATVVSENAVENLTTLIWPSPKTNNLATFYSHRFVVTGSNDVMKSAINYSAGFGYPDDASYVKYNNNSIWDSGVQRVISYTSKYYSTFSNTDNKTVSVTKTRTRTVTDYINGATLQQRQCWLISFIWLQPESQKVHQH